MDLPPVNASPEYASLFDDHSEYALIKKALEVLEAQLIASHEDIDRLLGEREEALANPEAFLEMLKDRGKCERVFPQLQTIYRVPDVDLTRYHQRRTSRRGTTKYEQNLDFIMGRLQSLQRTQSTLPPPLLSLAIPIHSSPSSAISATTLSASSAIRERFQSIQGKSSPLSSSQFVHAPPPRSASVPAILAPIRDYDNDENGGAAGEEDSKVGAVSDLGGLGRETPRLLTPSPVPQPTAKKGKGGKILADEAVSSAVLSHFNLPWSEEEKRRLEELLRIYPEEPVAARRIKKISLALGTRTAAQVANRLAKMQARQERHLRRDLEQLADPRELESLLLAEDQIDEGKKGTPEYAEYLRLKEELERYDIGVSIHEGFECDSCGVSPIRGVRWSCVDCPEGREVDLCAECAQRPFETDTHPKHHRLEKHGK